jgi:hypothetical protein
LEFTGAGVPDPSRLARQPGGANGYRGEIGVDLTLSEVDSTVDARCRPRADAGPLAGFPPALIDEVRRLGAARRGSSIGTGADRAVP